MAYLLGNQACMESLQSDVQDLQWTIKEIISRTGPVQAQSWKFPDKSACALDIDDLLDLYDCAEDSDDAEEKQVAHIALYELVIDRLVLLIQAMSKFSDGHLGSKQVTTNQNHENKVTGSIGLVAREHWSQMVGLKTLYQQLQSQSKSNSSKITELEQELGKTLSEHQANTPSTVSQLRTPELSTPGTKGLIPPNTADLVMMGMSPPSENASGLLISKDSNNKSCQTYETAFVPCDSCDIIQRKIRESGEIVIKACTDQGLPCSLKKFRNQVTHVEMLTFNDCCRWMAEQNKDIARIAKQIEVLQSSISPLKSEVKNCEKRTRVAEEKAKTCEKDMNEEKQTQAVLRKQIETKMIQQEKHYKELMEEEERQKGELRRNKEKLEQEMSNVKIQVEEQKKALKTLEADYRKLECDLDEKKQEVRQADQGAAEVENLKEQLAKVTAKLENNGKLLAKEQAKIKSASKHNESLQGKQETLLSRMDNLGRENEELSQQVASLEEEKITLEDKMTELKMESKRLNKKVKENEIVIQNLETEKKNIEGTMKEAQMFVQKLESELEEAKERERMIIEYPDLNGPINHDLHGTGNIAVDMQNQVSANCIRIKLLEEQNQSLSESIRKLSNLQMPSGYNQHAPMEPLPLWQQDSSLMVRNQVNDFHSNRDHSQILPQLGASDRSGPPQTKHHAWTFDHGQESPARDKTFHVSYTPSEEFMVGRANTPSAQQHKRSNSAGRQGRPSSAKVISVMAPVNATPIGAYTQMKKALGIVTGKEHLRKGRPPSGRTPVSIPGGGSGGGSRGGQGDGGDFNTPFSCPRCDKMYLKGRDLNIHMSYCTH